MGEADLCVFGVPFMPTLDRLLRDPLAGDEEASAAGIYVCCTQARVVSVRVVRFFFCNEAQRRALSLSLRSTPSFPFAQLLLVSRPTTTTTTTSFSL